jgi:hypothetical protein
MGRWTICSWGVLNELYAGEREVPVPSTAMPVMPNLSTLATASIAVWWAAVITAIVVVSERKTAPLAVVANPKPAPARAIALTHEPLPLSFGERFAAIEPTSAPPVPVVAEAAPADVSKLDKWNTAPAALSWRLEQRP